MQHKQLTIVQVDLEIHSFIEKYVCDLTNIKVCYLIYIYVTNTSRESQLCYTGSETKWEVNGNDPKGLILC